MEAWKSFFTDEILEVIVKSTNEKIRKFTNQVGRTAQKAFFFHETNKIEIAALFGLMYARGLLGQANLALHIVYREGFSHPVFGATMSRDRMKFLLSKISFDEEATRQQRWKNDRFAAVRDVHQMIMKRCVSAITPDDFLCIDESLYPMRTAVSFKQYNKTKPAKYGLLYRSMNSVRYPYTFATQVYAGKPVEIPT